MTFYEEFTQLTAPSSAASSTSHLLLVDYPPMLGAPREEGDPDYLWAGRLLPDPQSSQQVLAEGLHQARAPAVRDQVGVVVQAVDHAGQQREQCLLETHLYWVKGHYMHT